MIGPWEDDRWWYGTAPDPWGRDQEYLRDMTPGADEVHVPKHPTAADMDWEEGQPCPHGGPSARVGVPTAADVEAAERVIREMGWGEGG